MLSRIGIHIASAAALAAIVAPVSAELIVSDLVVEIHANAQPRKDLEIWNNSDERSYVVIAPAEVLNPGSAAERRVQEPDPEKLGLLVTPNRLVLEPGQRRIVRIARVSPEPNRERVYRITVKPVVGDLTSDQSGLKVLVGYDVLAIVRPIKPEPKISGVRDGKTLLVRNDGNSSAELINGRQCNSEGLCHSLPGKRLYAGSDWRVSLTSTGQVEFSIKVGDRLSPIRF